ncbi:MAG: hypothetical protein ACOYMN_20505 [Roseimicrobium sp.]
MTIEKHVRMSRHIMKATLKRTTVRLPASLLRQAKAFAAKRKMTVTHLIEAGLLREMKAAEVSNPPLILPVCSVSLTAPRPAKFPPGAENWSGGKWEEWCEEQEALEKEQTSHEAP